MNRTAILKLLTLTLCAGLIHTVFSEENDRGNRASGRSVISLAGNWDFKLDDQNEGIQKKWYTKEFSNTIPLPGSTDEAGYGNKDTRLHKDRLTREYEYVGAAWYKKTVTIPASWKGRHVELFLERCHWETRVWVDGKEIGMRESLSVPHVYDLTAQLTAGDHTIVVRVDNTIKYEIGDRGHSITDYTQTNWNGITGRIELRASAPISIESVQAYPDIAKKSLLVRVKIRNLNSLKGKRLFVAKIYDNAENIIGESSIESYFNSDKQEELELEIPLKKDVKLWSEFDPALYNLELTFGEDVYSRNLGIREVGVKDKRITINNRPVFLRGTLECCIFPLTGYPSTDVAEWERILKIIQSYGLNHMRFHSWCPPEAAFTAADKSGVYLQVELPNWTSVGVHEPTDQFWREELDRILDAYGNHPSFTFMCMGNELGGESTFLSELIQRGKARDTRHLYSGRTARGTLPEDDYYVAHKLSGPARGVFGPGTDNDFSEVIARAKVPFISHEIGQWCVYPDFAEIKKYTGHLKPHNLEFYRDLLEKNNMLALNKQFQQASGALAMLLYKEEVEVALRTPGFDGFQLLDLHDFPGQGTALVGVLDAFWDSKGLVTPEEFRRYCSQTVPLLRMSKRIWTSRETFTAKTQVAHFGAEAMTQAILIWKITDEKGSAIAQGELPALDVPIDNNTFPGQISAPLNKVSAPAKLKVTLGIKDTPISNSWEIWVYPELSGQAEPDDVLISDVFNEEVQQKLQTGGKVLLFINSANRNTLATDFLPLFWCGAFFKGQPRQLGILCDPNHPCLAGFPAEYHTNWQWYHLLKGAKSLELSKLPPEVKPIVRMVDDWNTNRPLGLIVESKAGKGKLITCGVDLQGEALNRPEARQLLQSILTYMQSSEFNPQHEIPIQTLADLFFTHPYLSVESVSSENAGNEGELAIDRDPTTLWHSKWEGKAAPYPHSITLRLEHEAWLTGLTYLPRTDRSQNGLVSDYEIYVSMDGKTWGEPVKKGTLKKDKIKQILFFDSPKQARFIRFTALRATNNKNFAGIAELDVLFQ